MKKLRTVVADDNDSFRSSLIELLRRLPEITVVGEARDGVEALHCVDELDPDLLLLDLQMPKLNGWQVLQRLQSRGARVKVVILSGYANSLFAPVVEERGVVAYLAKGDPKALSRVISE